MMKKVFQVEGMMCENCENRVMRALMQIEGMQDCRASATENVVACTFDEAKTDDATIKQALMDTGYDVIA